MNTFAIEFRLSLTIWDHLDLFGTRVEHNFAPLWTIWSGFESSHNELGTNLGCFFTFKDGMMAHP